MPFHPQERDYCGPAALAEVMEWSGVATDQQDLGELVFTPGRRGTMGHDMVGAARRHGRLALPVADLSALLVELDAEHPVVVLQNLGLSWYPNWHYAVAVGYDLQTGTLLLQSGREQREVISLTTFEQTWQRADHWGLLVLPPDQLPVRADETAVLSAAAGLKRVGRPREAASAYAAALRRWPDSLGALIGAGNARYALGDLRGAEAANRAAVERYPEAAVAWNNLAQVLRARGLRGEATNAASRAIQLGGLYSDTYRRTLREVTADSL